MCRDAVLLVLAAGSRLSAYIGATVGEIGFLRGIWLDGAKRLAWLEDYAAALVARADLPVPARLRQGIRFEHVSFAYPGTKRLVLEDVCLDLRAGSVVGNVRVVDRPCVERGASFGRKLLQGSGFGVRPGRILTVLDAGLNEPRITEPCLTAGAIVRAVFVQPRVGMGAWFGHRGESYA